MAQCLHQGTVKLLVVDVGNTSTAVGLWFDGRVKCVSHCDGGFVESSAAASEKLDKFSVDGIAYVSVVPSVDAKWRRFAKGRGLMLHAVSCRDFPLETSGGKLSIDYPKPETIGADRLADAAGAVARYGAPVVVMDFGTALTAAVVTEDLRWRGGVIAPGFPLMRDYLFERTAKLPRMEIGRGKEPKIGRSTEEAMRFGAIVGYRGMVKEIVSTLEKNFGGKFNHVATGGFAKWALSGMDADFKIDQNLTLYGTGLICAKFI